ncbi:MAG: hypothetical protein H0T51_01260 [Pirellulales bacterium]|nr:hypothetical protein [Pirellulales bacterium]
MSANLPGLTPEVPTSANISLDDDGGGFNDSLGGAGDGWFFDQTPLDDAEFTSIANSAEGGAGHAFQSSFVDVATPNLNFNDFYRTIVHEIGHALGIYLSTNSLLDRLYSMTTDIGDDPNSSNAADRLRTFNGASGLVTFTTNGGGHVYEGSIGDAPAIVSHPNELMNAGRTVPPNGANPAPTIRQYISDLDVRLLDDAYNYTTVLPNALNTAHANLDSQTGTLLVQGRDGALNDTINIDVVGFNIRVQVNGTTELVPQASVTQIVIAGNGGTDTISVAAPLAPLRKDVQYVVSSNQDSAAAGTLGDGIVDLDVNVPGRQVALSAAIVDANGTAAGSSRSIYVPRGNYNLTISGTGGDTQGDLDVNRHLTIIGAGAGATVIDASTLATRDRLFEIASTGSLDLSRATLTGGYVTSSGGGGIRVANNPTAGVVELKLSDATIVGNTADPAVNSGSGGGMIVSAGATAQITRSAIVGNTALGSTGGGGIFSHADSVNPGAVVTLDRTIVANNAASVGPDLRSLGGSSPSSFTSAGGNMLTSVAGSNFATSGLQGTDYQGSASYVVTSVVDSFDNADNARALSVREAVGLANAAAGAQTMWLPAWSFVLTRQRTTTLAQGDVDVSHGDLDITDDLVIRGSGVSNATSVKWRAGISDAVFDLIGDFNGNGVTSDDGYVEGSDYLIWQTTLGSDTDLRADADDNGIVQGADRDLWSLYYGNVLTLTNVA